jgi:hypothetical protein
MRRFAPCAEKISLLIPLFDDLQIFPSGQRPLF